MTKKAAPVAAAPQPDNAEALALADAEALALAEAALAAALPPAITDEGAPHPQQDSSDAEALASVLRYVVTNDRIGHPVGTVLEFDHEPHELFLRCLSLVQEEAPE